ITQVSLPTVQEMSSNIGLNSEEQTLNQPENNSNVKTIFIAKNQKIDIINGGIKMPDDVEQDEREGN
ncbi:hypothetical protein, partial [Aliarcobacter cryaerophilus]